MAKRTVDKTEKEYARAGEKARGEKYILRLYVAGMTPRSVRAIKNVKKVCDELLAGRCDLEVIDIYQNPKLAKGEQIIAAPTLVKKLPLPLRRVIGDMSDTEKFLVGIDLKPRQASK